MKASVLLATAISCFMMTTAQAEFLSADLSQDNKKVSAEIQEKGELSIEYNLLRKPVLRNSEWWYYALRCSASNRSTLEYTVETESHVTTLPALLSNDDDGQKVGLNIDERGLIKIKNNSHEKIQIYCELYNKFGM